MKKIFLFLLFAGLAIGTVQAQKSFEGKITFKVSLQGEGADMMSAFMPNSYEYHISGSNLLFRMVGGMTAAMMGDVIVHGEEGKAYMVKRSEEVAYLMPDDSDDEEDDSDTEVEKMDETEKIQGYVCQKYKVTMTGDKPDEKGVQYMWVTEELNIAKPKGGGSNAGGAIVEGINGFPLKMVTEIQGMTMVMTASEIEKGSVPASTFEIPSDYEVKDFNPAMFGR